MCVIFLYVNSNPGPNGYKLIVANNRDEFFARKTSNAHKWTNCNVYGGTDMESGREGGTWLAIGGGGGMIKLGALLNLTGEPHFPDAIGRGMLVTDFVSNFDHQHDIKAYNETLINTCTQYNGFNFASLQIGNGKPASICVLSNVPPGLTDFKEGECLGFGNSLPNMPFEKVNFAKAQFAEIVKEYTTQAKVDNAVMEKLRTNLKDNLMSLLKKREKHWPDVELKRRAPNWGEYLSSINVHIPHGGYGSRTHTVILVDANDCLHFYESTLQGLDPDQDNWHDSYFQHPNFSQNYQTKL